MLSSKSVLCLLLASVALAEINTDFHHVLYGQEALTDALVSQMYNQFLSEYESTSGGFLLDGSTVHDRKPIFASKVKEIVEHNTNTDSKYKKGINSYSDMTDVEFTNYFHIVAAPQDCSATHKAVQVGKNKVAEIPTHWDWREHGGVSPVKNQASCGSCWAFSTVGCVEAHYMIKYGQFRNLSE
jgi:cathepsin L